MAHTISPDQNTITENGKVFKFNKAGDCQSCDLRESRICPITPCEKELRSDCENGNFILDEP